MTAETDEQKEARVQGMCPSQTVSSAADKSVFIINLGSNINDVPLPKTDPPICNKA